ncbi:uncharacterized protein LOC127108044 [Lathyrus oleraceus]|uniref:uncharacterized protein LOC127108041 n=1 Tax=Pisum sativum TaxID=3888 RepID=UPI0021D1077E|nr:uncharacterized protein LOC127108041 [Pisum sativum]XP_050901362.1 uncharacterized protein LOC127108042 [Pisum sativum]XP_050901363.1 uncharacterized protein LOC127108043 [Pisum sativum]XP_050901364.1 uncharacterized protein LOC127108044 [Pisum sativum]
MKLFSSRNLFSVIVSQKPISENQKHFFLWLKLHLKHRKMKSMRNVKYEEALEKFESVLGTKLEPNEAAVAGFELPRCKQCSHIHNCHGATTTTSSCTDVSTSSSFTLC